MLNCRTEHWPVLYLLSGFGGKLSLDCSYALGGLVSQAAEFSTDSPKCLA